MKLDDMPLPKSKEEAYRILLAIYICQQGGLPMDDLGVGLTLADLLANGMLDGSIEQMDERTFKKLALQTFAEAL